MLSGTLLRTSECEWTSLFFFFFQAEDGIRDYKVTGVQTCALPIFPLPASLTRTEKMLRRVGMGGYADELVLTMNRAAEAAVPEARQLLVDSIRKMTISDAKGILAGGDTAGTEYFRRTTRDPLRGRFLPNAKRATAKG